jgi:hypothetical protein
MSLLVDLWVVVNEREFFPSGMCNLKVERAVGNLCLKKGITDKGNYNLQIFFQL